MAISFLKTIILLKLVVFVSKIEAQCPINPACKCRIRNSIYELTCYKTSNQTGFIDLKFNLSLTNFDYYMIDMTNSDYTTITDFAFRGIKIGTVNFMDNKMARFFFS